MSMVSLKLMAGAAIRMVVTSARTEAGRDSTQHPELHGGVQKMLSLLPVGGGPGVGRMRAAFHLLWVGLVRLLKVVGYSSACAGGRTLPPDVPAACGTLPMPNRVPNRTYT